MYTCPACAGHVAPGKRCWKCGRTGCETCGGKPDPGTRCISCHTVGHHAAPPRSTFSADPDPQVVSTLPPPSPQQMIDALRSDPTVPAEALAGLPARIPEPVFVVTFTCGTCAGTQRIRCQGMDRLRVEMFASLTTARNADGTPWDGYLHSPLGSATSEIGRCGLCKEQTLTHEIVEGER